MYLGNEPGLEDCVTCRWCDGDEPCHHALHCTNDGRFPKHNDVQCSPGQETGSSADVRVEDRQAGDDVGTEGRPAVEARPPHPQQPRSGEHEQHIVGWKPLSVLRYPWPHLRAFPPHVHKLSNNLSISMNKHTTTNITLITSLVNTNKFPTHFLSLLFLKCSLSNQPFFQSRF